MSVCVMQELVGDDIRVRVYETARTYSCDVHGSRSVIWNAWTNRTIQPRS